MSSVASIRRVVVLPAPLGPRKPKISPAPTARSTPRTASTSRLARIVKVRTRSCVCDHRLVGRRRGHVDLLSAMLPWATSLAPFSIFGQYLHRADNHPSEEMLSTMDRRIDRFRPPLAAPRQPPGVALRPHGRPPVRPVRVRHRGARGAHRQRRGDRRQAVRPDGPDDRRGHPRDRPPGAVRLRPPRARPDRPAAGHRRGRARAASLPSRRRWPASATRARPRSASTPRPSSPSSTTS